MESYCNTAEPWSWRNRLTPQSEPEDSPFNYSTPILMSSALITPPSSGNTIERVLPTAICETPRTHRLSLGISNLRQDLNCKCNISERKEAKTAGLPSIEEEREPEVRKRRLTDYHFSPNKKFRLIPGTPKKISQVICCHQKENSPIKVDFGGGAPKFILKPPPRKLDAPCPAHNAEFLDILGAMAKRNMYRILLQVLSHFSPTDILEARKVSRSWKQIIHEVTTDKALSQAKQQALTSKENLPLLGRPAAQPATGAKSKNETTPLKHYIIQNKNPSPKRRTILSAELSPPSKRFASHLREGKTLGKGEKLTQCPKCRSPAAVIPGRASSDCSECRYNFCPQCRCSAHVGKICNFVVPSSPETPPMKKQVIGSKSSKRALRRLLT